jgi:hypothetical protein
LNIASALIKQIIVLQDSDTWSYLRKHYLPNEYHTIFSIIDGHSQKYHTVPTFEDLKFEIRDSATQEKLLAIEALEVEAEPSMLLQYLKNEYTQKEILYSLEKYIDHSISFEDAEESVSHLHQIVLDIEEKVELEQPQESMQRISLFPAEEELEKYLPLGMNSAFDEEFKFSPRDLILVGGRRGSGKSITCCNIANTVYESGKSAIYFTIEMDSREILQRCCSIATGVPHERIRKRNLSVTEWGLVAAWWANRFVNPEEKLNLYKEHRDFDRLHYDLKTNCELLPTQQLDVVYDASLTLSKIRAELDKKVKSAMDVGVIIVDYINQVKRSNLPSRAGQYDWTEQIEVSKALKSMAQEYEVPVYSPYQIDATGEARFAKGILDAADAAFTIDTWRTEDAIMTFNCTKMRSGKMGTFTSTMNWETLKIGPESALTPDEKEENEHKTGEEINDI